MKINNIELEDLDLMDADVVESVEFVMEKVTNESKEIEKIKSYSEMIRKQCDLVYYAFDELFGEGTGETLFEGKSNLRVCVNAFENLVKFINDKQGEIEKEYSKYSSNRATRRNKK